MKNKWLKTDACWPKVQTTEKSTHINIKLFQNIWAASCQNQRSGCAPSEDSDQPGHPPSLNRVSACAQWVAKDPSYLHADSEDSDQTGRMPSMIWVFAGRTVTLLVLSCRGSNANRKIWFSSLFGGSIHSAISNNYFIGKTTSMIDHLSIINKHRLLKIYVLFPQTIPERDLLQIICIRDLFHVVLNDVKIILHFLIYKPGKKVLLDIML